MHRWTIALILATSAVTFTACGSTDSPDESLASGLGTSGASVSCDYVQGGQASKPVRLPARKPDDAAPARMLISTSAGDISLAFDIDAAPCTVSSFVSLAKQGYFNNTSCHRLTTEGIYVLQCGDPTGTGTGGPGYTIPDELISADSRLEPCQPSTGACTYSPGYVAMANTGTGHSGGSQFFLVYREFQLEPRFTVFAHTNAGGLKVLQHIATAGTADGTTDGSPKEVVKILSVR